MHQLALPLTQRRAPPRQQPVIERLFAVLKRQGFDTHWRALKGSTSPGPSRRTGRARWRQC